MPLDWQVQQLRLSIFASTAINLTEAHWKELTGQEEAENRTAVPNGKQYSGNFLNGMFIMAHYGQRSDVMLSYGGATNAAEPEMPCLGPFDDILGVFQKSVEPFLAALEAPVVRLAFGAILMCPTNSRQASYEQLAQMLSSVKVDPSRMRELLYRINWPQPSKVLAAIELNRLTTWSSQTLVQGVLQVSGAQMSVETVPSEVHMTRLDIDNNTDQKWATPFERDTRIAIFQELLDMARGNAVAGECP